MYFNTTILGQFLHCIGWYLVLPYFSIWSSYYWAVTLKYICMKNSVLHHWQKGTFQLIFKLNSIDISWKVPQTLNNQCFPKQSKKPHKNCTFKAVPPASCIEEHPISCISNLWSCFKICDIATAKEDQSHEGQKRYRLRPFYSKDLLKLAFLVWRGRKAM